MTTTSISELAPCPFCDKQSAIQVFEADDIGGWLAGCCAQTWGDTEAEAIAAWNTRSIPTAAPDDAAVERARFITTWRKTDNVLEWDHYVSESGDEAARVVGNLKHQGVRQYHTYALGAAVDELSTLIARAALTASIPDAAPESDHG